MTSSSDPLEVAALSGAVDAVIGAIVERLMQLEGADGATCSTIEDGYAVFKYSLGKDAPLEGRVPLAETLGPLAVEAGDVVVLRAEGDSIEESLTAGARTIVLSPIQYNGRVRGILGVRSSDRHAFDDRTVDEIRLLTHGAGIALRNAEVVARLADSERRYRELYAQAADATEQLHAIIETQQEISALELDPQAVTAGILERTQRLTGADGAGVVWFEGDEAVTHFASGIATVQIGSRLSREHSLAGMCAQLGRPLYASDTETDPRVAPDTFARLQARSLLAAPLYRDGEPVGSMSVMARKANAFDELAIETTRLMAQFVSTVMRNASELETRRTLVEELRTQGEVVEHMQTALWVWSYDAGSWRLEHANAASEHATGVPARELTGRLYDEVLPASNGTLRTILDDVRESGAYLDAGEFPYSDGRIDGVFWIKAFPLPAERVAMTFENVTERVRATRALQESESRFRSAFNASSLGMTLVSLDGAYLAANERFAEMLGYTRDELARMRVRDVTPPDQVERDLEVIGLLRSGGSESEQFEKQYIRKDGSTFWATVAAGLVRDYDGSPSHIVGHVQDVTAQREANLLFEATFERSVMPMVIFDDELAIVDANDAFAALLGLDRAATAGRAFADFASEAIDLHLGQFRADGRLEAHATLRRPDGQEREVELVATANVRPGRHIAVVRDVTRQNELELQLRQAQKMEAVGRLAGGIAHDFNNLLTAIAGYSEFLIGGLDDPRLRRHAEEIKKASDRAASLTGQLLAFSRRQVLQPRVLDLNAVVSDMDMMLRRLIGEDVELITLLEPALGAVRADPTQVEQVIVNLAVNARDAMPHGGSVTVETANVSTDAGDYVELRMSDTGIGMTDEERQQLFDPFFTTKEGGTGLGLATVYGIVEQSGGTIEVESAPGLGSSFRILLPRAREAAELPAPTPAAARPSSGSETILLVEDETVVRQLVAEILESSGYSVLQAGDGPSALELLRRHTGPLDLLVTDVVMPGMSGPEVAQAVTSMRPGTHVLYTSGYTDQAIGHHGVLEPDVAFLQKPFSADDLNRKVRGLLDGVAVPVD
jgi:PAS domain S-box-containing protein